MKAPRQWLWWDGVNVVVDPTQPTYVDAGLDFWRVPYRYPDLTPIPPTANNLPAPIPTPRNVEQVRDPIVEVVNPSNDRFRQAVRNTALASLALVTIPENRTGLQTFKDKLMPWPRDETDTVLDEREARIPLDAWNNPILLVPGSGIYDVTVGGVVKPKTDPVRAPDNQPFWASAGPDGDFQKGDDNIYSFEE